MVHIDRPSAQEARRVIPFTARHLYPAVRRCIYCSNTGVATGTLGEEHIIPLSFGGNLIIPLASCRSCERMTSAIEDHCVKGMISTARPHLGIRGRQSRKNLVRGPIYIDRNNRVETRSLQLHSHPGAIIMPLLRYPTALVGAALPSKDTPVEMQLAIKPATADVGRRANKIGLPVSLTKGLSALQFYRFIAKIAHAFTAAELGMDAFTPCLLNLIRGETPMFADHYVGSGIGNDPPVPHLHELSFVPQAPVGCSEQIVVRIRLFANLDMPTFANLDMPTHYAVSGYRRVS